MPRAPTCDGRAEQSRGPPEAGPCKRPNGDEGHPAGNAGLSSRAGYRHGVAGRAGQERQEIPGSEGPVNEATAPRRSGTFAAGLAGGIIGSLLTAAVLFFALPNVLSSRIVRQGLLADPKILTDAVDALRDAQYEPVLAANRAAIETPFGSSWKGAAKPDVTLVEFFDYACPYCKASNPTVDRLMQEDKGLRVVYRELPILGPDSVTAARLSLEASKLGRFAKFHDALWAAGRPAPETNATAAKAAGIDAAPTRRPRDRGRAQAQLPARRPARRDGHTAVRHRRPRDERRRRLRCAETGDRRCAREEELGPLPVHDELPAARRSHC